MCSLLLPSLATVGTLAVTATLVWVPAVRAGGLPDFQPRTPEFVGSDQVHFAFDNTTDIPVVPAGKAPQAPPVTVRFEWRDEANATTLHTADWSVPASRLTALNPPPSGASGFTFRSDDSPDVHAMLRDPTIATAQARILRITLDATNAVAEADESNNSIDVTRPLPDFLVSSPVFSFAQLKFKVIQFASRAYWLGGAGQPLAIRFQWLNRGRQPLGGFRVWDAVPILITTGRPGLYSLPGPQRFYLFDSTRSRPATIQPIREYLLRGNIPLGARFLRIEVNPDGATPESRTDNNVLDVPRPLPDLVVSSELTWQEFPDDGRTYPLRHLSFRIRNRGNEHVFTDRPGALLGIRFSWLRGKVTPVGRSITWDASDIILTPAFQRSQNVIFHSSAAQPVQRWLDEGVPKGATALRVELDPLNFVEEQSDSNTYTKVIRPKAASATTGRTRGTVTTRPTLSVLVAEAIQTLVRTLLGLR